MIFFDYFLKKLFLKIYKISNESHDIDVNRKVSTNDKVKAKNSIITRIREEEINNMNLLYFERHRNEQFLL